MIGNDYVWQDFLLNYQLYKNVGDLFFLMYIIMTISIKKGRTFFSVKHLWEILGLSF